MAAIASKNTLPPPFDKYELDDAYDEMADSSGAVRPHYRHLYKTLLGLPREELRRRQQVADLSFLHQGITFTVYGREEGTEKIFPNGSRAFLRARNGPVSSVASNKESPPSTFF